MKTILKNILDVAVSPYVLLMWVSVGSYGFHNDWQDGLFAGLMFLGGIVAGLSKMYK